MIEPRENASLRGIAVFVLPIRSTGRRGWALEVRVRGVDSSTLAAAVLGACQYRAHSHDITLYSTLFVAFITNPLKGDKYSGVTEPC